MSKVFFNNYHNLSVKFFSAIKKVERVDAINNECVTYVNFLINFDR